MDFWHRKSIPHLNVLGLIDSQDSQRLCINRHGLSRKLCNLFAVVDSITDRPSMFVREQSCTYSTCFLFQNRGFSEKKNRMAEAAVEIVKVLLFIICVYM